MSRFEQRGFDKPISAKH